MRPLLWLVNGVLALFWLVVEYRWAVALLPALGYMVLHAPKGQRPWTLGVALLALLAGIVAPFPVALLLLVMTLSGLVAVRLERLNPQNTHWTLVRGLGLYSLAGLGFAAYRALLLPALTDPALQQGQAYLSALASIALYLLPLGYLALLAQGLLVHPPLEGEADDLLYRFRSRGKP